MFWPLLILLLEAILCKDNYCTYTSPEYLLLFFFLDILGGLQNSNHNAAAGMGLLEDRLPESVCMTFPCTYSSFKILYMLLLTVSK